mgnify:CR=1 FL=1
MRPPSVSNGSCGTGETFRRLLCVEVPPFEKNEMNPEIALPSSGIDVQASQPATRVSLSRVGVTGVEKVLNIAGGNYHAELECFVDLGPDQAGVHMSRFEENVAEAISVVRPFAVDVASGVESEAGIKDPELLEALFEAVRGAMPARA